MAGCSATLRRLGALQQRQLKVTRTIRRATGSCSVSPLSFPAAFFSSSVCPCSSPSDPPPHTHTHTHTFETPRAKKSSLKAVGGVNISGSESGKIFESVNQNSARPPSCLCVSVVLTLCSYNHCLNESAMLPIMLAGKEAMMLAGKSSACSFGPTVNV